MRVIVFFLLAACGSHAATPASPARKPVTTTDPVTKPAPPTGNLPAAERVTADSPRETAAGVAYIVPAGWTVVTSGSITVMHPEEEDAHVALVDASDPDGDAAVATAWKLNRSSAAPPLKLAVDLPAREGWDQIRQYGYELPPNDKRVAFAIAMRHGTWWAVILIDAAQATLERRGAQFRLFADSVRPAGYTRESFAGKTANQLDAARLARIGQLIESGRRQLGIPGVSVAIVQDGKVILARGYGVRELGKKPRVDADSLYLIASNTKALTTLLLAEFVDDGKLRWDQPVTEVDPDFKLGNAETTASAEIKHLVCACTGLPRQDLEFLFEFAHATPQTELAALAGIQPTSKFGETFQYSNMLAAAAGFVAAHVISPKLELGKAYDQAMRTRVFGPLGMKTTTFDFARALRANHASPHSRDVDGKPTLVTMAIDRAVIPVRPAGGAWSSANDLIRYVQLELAGGVAPGGKRLVSEANLLVRRKPNVAVGEHGQYGMGLMVDTTWGIPVIHHGGSMIGYKSDMIWLPDHGVGAVILTNADSGGILTEAFRRYLVEQLFDGKPQAEEDIASWAATTAESIAKERSRLDVPPAADAVAALARHYDNPALGTIDVLVKDGVTTFDFGEWNSAVASRKNDDGTVSFVAIAPGTPFQFVAGASADGKRQLTIRDGQHEYVFVEGPAK